MGLLDLFKGMSGGGLLGSGQGSTAPAGGGFGAGWNRFQDSNPALFMALGDVISGEDPRQSLMYGNQVRAQNAERADKTERENKTRKWLIGKGIAPEEVDAAIAAGQIGQYFKPQEGPAPTDDIKEYQYALQNDMFDGSFTEWQTKGIRDQDPTFGRERDTRRDYDGEDVVKNYKKVRDSYERIRTSAATDSGPGDIGLIFNYMKMLDPGSVVREGEFATAANSGGVGETVRNLYNNLLSGERLSPDLRGQFVTAADKLYGESASNLEDTNTRYSDIASSWGLQPDRIVAQPEKYEPLKLGETRKMKPGVSIKRIGD